MSPAPTIQYSSILPSSLRGRSPDPLRFLETLAESGNFVPFFLGRQRAILLNRPDYVGTVLVSCESKFQKGDATRRARSLLGDGLLTAAAELNKERRKIIQPAFARQHLEACASVIVARARAMCGLWNDEEIVDVTHALAELTFGIVGETIIGARTADEFEEVRSAVSDATESLDPLMTLVAPLTRVRRARARLRGAVERLLRRASDSARKGSLLALLDAHQPESGMPSQQRVDDVLTILLAGHDTITSALTWALCLLSLHPACESAMRHELDSVLGNRDATADDVPRLVYTRAVLSEALRMYPPAWVLARQAVEPHEFEEGTVPSGAVVLVSQYLLHRDARYFARPWQFDPDRWSPHGQQAITRFAFFPFGAGSRSCIGESFAWMEGVLLLATVCRQRRLRLENDVFPAVEPRITLRPRGHVRMRVSS